MDASTLGFPIITDADRIDGTGYSSELASVLDAYMRELYSWGRCVILKCGTFANDSSNDFFMYAAQNVETVINFKRPVSNDVLSLTYAKRGIVGLAPGATALVWGRYDYSGKQGMITAGMIGATTNPNSSSIPRAVSGSELLMQTSASQTMTVTVPPCAVKNTNYTYTYYGIGGRCAMAMGGSGAMFGILVLDTGRTMPPSS